MGPIRHLKKELERLIVGNRPKLSRSERKLVTSRLELRHVVLEWGSGPGTVYFSPLAASYYSIEHDEHRYERVQRELVRNRRTNVQHLLVRPSESRRGAPNHARPSEARYSQYRDYIDYPQQLGVPRFDRVLINGRSRPECALAVLPQLAEDAVVFVFDYFTSKYPAGEYDRMLGDHYEVIDCVTTNRTLAVLRPRTISAK